MHGGKTDIKIIVHVADAVENVHLSTMIQNFALFFVPFPHYLGAGNRLTDVFILEGILSLSLCLWDSKFPTHTLSKGLWSI